VFKGAEGICTSIPFLPRSPYNLNINKQTNIINCERDPTLDFSRSALRQSFIVYRPSFVPSYFPADQSTIPLFSRSVAPFRHQFLQVQLFENAWEDDNQPSLRIGGDCNCHGPAWESCTQWCKFIGLVWLYCYTMRMLNIKLGQDLFLRLQGSKGSL